MVKKLKEQASEDDTQLANAVRTSAQQIWQAGLGAFAKAQEEGGRVFSKLVQEGNELQLRTLTMAEDKAAGVKGSAAEVADAVGRHASGSWDKLEKIFEDRVARALTTMGVPTQNEIEALTLRVEELSRQVAELRAQAGPAPAATKTAAKKAAVRTAAVKTAAVKPTAAKTTAVKKTAPEKPAAKKPAVKKAAAKKA